MILFAIFIVLGDVCIHGHFRGCMNDFILRCFPHAVHPLRMTMAGYGFRIILFTFQANLMLVYSAK